MLAQKDLPADYREWNRVHGAPSGGRLFRRTRNLPLQGVRETVFKIVPSLRGRFGFQQNNSTRAAEYPWAFYATPIAPGLKVLEIGGGLSGFQFVLAAAGCDVVNVDPGMEARGRGWPVDAKSMRYLNRAFGTNVVLHNGFLADVPYAPNSFDRIFSISVVEHIPEPEIPELMVRAYELLKPGGYFVLTVDLFLNLKPFCSRESNEFGTNVSVRRLAESAPFELVKGNRAELFGYPEFDPKDVLARLETLMLGTYPAIPQLLVLRKPERAC